MVEKNDIGQRPGDLSRGQCANRDYLTGYLNRRGLYEYVEGLEKDAVLNMMFLDIDNFKGVNDTYGHATGDKLLISVSHMIKSRIGDSLLVRMGGDEFVIVMQSGIPEKAAAGMAESIINSVNDIDISIEIKSIISFSIGIVMDQKKSLGLDSIMPKCDAAMYEAKRRGKNGYVLYSTIEDLFEFKQIVDREKSQAIGNGDFEVRLIPVMDVSASTMVCARTYVMWNRGHDHWGEEMFYDIFEENGFIIELEKYVFETICEKISRIEDARIRAVPIIINTSGISINRVNFTEELVAVVNKYKLSSENFIIQLRYINERIDANRIIRFFQNLKEAGFGTAVKGFGNTGSPVMIIKSLNLDYVSVGKDISDNLLNDRKDSLFVKNILSLINDLNFEPIVEGIYDQRQVAYLATYECSLGSGTLFAGDLGYEEYLQFASENIPALVKSVRFAFHNNLKDDSGKLEGKYIGEGREQYVYDQELKKEVLYLTGGRIFENVVELPAEIMKKSSYSIMMRFKMEKFTNWSSLVYTLYEGGFMSFIPYAWGGLPIFRIKDDMDENGWRDAVGNKFDNGWHTVVLTFSHKNAISRLYMDGECIAFRDDVLTLNLPKQIIIGGDVYAPSCEGFVDEIQFFDYVLDKKYIENY